MPRPALSEASPATPPHSLRLLCVGEEEPSWVALTMQLSARDCDEPSFRWSSTSNEALTILRHQMFDCLLIAARSGAGRGSFDVAEALRLVEAMRSSGQDEPVLLLTESLPDEQWEQFIRFDCEVVITDRLWDSPTLVPLVIRAVRGVTLAREYRQLQGSHHRRVSQERSEADEFLKQQKQILCDAALLGGAAPQKESATTPMFSPEIQGYYQQLLRTFVMMGSGSLSTDIRSLAQLLVQSGHTPRSAFALHVAEIESLTVGLGHRSARHAVARGDLLALELLLCVGEMTAETIQSPTEPSSTA